MGKIKLQVKRFEVFTAVLPILPKQLGAFLPSVPLPSLLRVKRGVMDFRAGAGCVQGCFCSTMVQILHLTNTTSSYQAHLLTNSVTFPLQIYKQAR